MGYTAEYEASANELNLFVLEVERDTALYL